MLGLACMWDKPLEKLSGPKRANVKGPLMATLSEWKWVRMKVSLLARWKAAVLVQLLVHKSVWTTSAGQKRRWQLQQETWMA